MNAKELRAKDEAALKQELQDLLNTHFKLRMQKATQQLQNTASLRQTRRDIARVRTILTEKATTNDGNDQGSSHAYARRRRDEQQDGQDGDRPC